MRYFNNSLCGMPFFSGQGGMLIMGLIFTAVIITALLLISGRKKETLNDQKGNAFEILQERLAKGEINPEEFIKLKKVLGDV